MEKKGKRRFQVYVIVVYAVELLFSRDETGTGGHQEWPSPDASARVCLT